MLMDDVDEDLGTMYTLDVLWMEAWWIGSKIYIIALKVRRSGCSRNQPRKDTAQPYRTYVIILKGFQ